MTYELLAVRCKEELGRRTRSGVLVSVVGEFGFFSECKHRRERHDMTKSLSLFIFVHLCFNDAEQLFCSYITSKWYDDGGGDGA